MFDRIVKTSPYSFNSFKTFNSFLIPNLNAEKIDKTDKCSAKYFQNFLTRIIL